MKIGMIGLSTMGQSLAENVFNHQFEVIGYDINQNMVEDYLLKHPDRFATSDLQQWINQLPSSKIIWLMVPAGQAVDDVLESLFPYLQPNDIVIDGGNSHYQDTIRRHHLCHQKQIAFVGMGVSGGEYGALHGPSLMPSASKEVYAQLQPLLETICAHVDGEPCCTNLGTDGAGHFVKMVHNGIEYGDMQLIAETYQLLRDGLGYSPQKMAELFQTWNHGQLNSYLIEITAKILRQEEQGVPLVDLILDAARQKGTGKWTSVVAFDLGIPLTLISQAVFMRYLSSQNQQRVNASKILYDRHTPMTTITIDELQDALYVAKIISYAQGFALLKQASDQYQWQLDFGKIAKIWRGGCIIRSQFLNQIYATYQQEPDLDNLMTSQYFAKILNEKVGALRKVCLYGLDHGIPINCLTSALGYFDGYRLAKGSANLIQAQRDFFGAHRFERVDDPSGKTYHYHWPQEEE